MNDGWVTRTTGFTLTHHDGRWLVVRQVRLGVSAWELPGGHVEPGETPSQAALRETLEETGVAVRVGQLVAVAVHEWARERERRQVLFHLAVPLRPHDPPQPATDPVGEVRWVRPDQLDRGGTSPFLHPLLEAWPGLLVPTGPPLTYRLHQMLDEDGHCLSCSLDDAVVAPASRVGGVARIV